MNITHCQTCGHRLKVVKPLVALAAVDTATMTDAELFTHYKQTGPLEDARFFQRTVGSTLPRDLGQALVALIAEAPKRVEFLRRLTAIQDQWRILSKARERVTLPKAA